MIDPLVSEFQKDAAEAEERLRQVSALLGLAPSSKGWQGRVAYLAFLIASDAGAEAIARAEQDVELLRPGYLQRVADWRRDFDPRNQ